MQVRNVRSSKLKYFDVWLVKIQCSKEMPTETCTRAKDNIDEDALNKKLEERLNDGLNHIQRVLVGRVVLSPITLDEMKFGQWGQWKS